METKTRKQTLGFSKRNQLQKQRQKSKTTLFWEKYFPNGEKGEILDMRAVLK